VRVSSPPAAVVWHDLECGGYRADLRLWHDLAARADGPLLEIGAGTGRVALALARAGHGVIAVERDPVLARELRARAQGLPVQVVCADARDLDLPERGLGLCLVPMQTVQLLAGAAGRGRLLSAVHAHLRPGALLACAIVEQLDAFDDDGPQPLPDRVRVDGTLYVSQPTAVRVGPQRVVLERRRESRAADGTRTRTHDAVELDRLSRRELEREAVAAGWQRGRARTIGPTPEHVGSTVAMLRA
jgi:SAM-dependent methyltransferase